MSAARGGGVVPSSFTSPLSLLLMLVRCCHRQSLPVVLALRHTALVHLPSTRRAVAHQHGVGAPLSIILIVVWLPVVNVVIFVLFSPSPSLSRYCHCHCCRRQRLVPGLVLANVVVGF